MPRLHEPSRLGLPVPNPAPYLQASATPFDFQTSLLFMKLLEIYDATLPPPSQLHRQSTWLCHGTEDFTTCRQGCSTVEGTSSPPPDHSQGPSPKARFPGALPVLALYLPKSYLKAYIHRQSANTRPQGSFLLKCS